MDSSSLRALIVTLGVALSPFAQAEVRTWTTGPGVTVEGEYIRSTPDAVIVKRSPDGQALRIALKDGSPEDRAYVEEKQAAEREANTIEVAAEGVINWRLPDWNSLSWSNNQPAELWSWNETERKPGEKLADFMVSYEKDPKRNQFTGTFVTPDRVKFLKTDKFVIIGKFSCTVNRETKNLQQTSTPFPLPNSFRDRADLGTFRFTLTR